jgi:hypothetical protein
MHGHMNVKCGISSFNMPSVDKFNLRCTEKSPNNEKGSPFLTWDPIFTMKQIQSESRIS